jgi:hypothetical protein
VEDSGKASTVGLAGQVHSTTEARLPAKAPEFFAKALIF